MAPTLRPHRRLQRWLRLLAAVFAGLLLVLACFRILNLAHAEQVQAAAAPPEQSILESSQMQVLYASRDARQTNGLAWGDVDGDGDLDLAAGNGDFPGSSSANYDKRNTIYYNDGTGSFTPIDIDALTDSTQAVAWGDWDGDGDLDLAVVNDGAANYVYENVSGALQLDPENRLGWQSPDEAPSSSVGWGDVDGDGDLDLAVGNRGGRNQLFENISGTLALIWQPPSDLDLDTRAIAWADYDLDGDLDLAVGNYGGETQVYENISGTLELDVDDDSGWVSVPIPAEAEVERCTPGQFFGDWVDPQFGTRTRDLSWGDWDGDGDPDLAVGGGSDDNDCGAFLFVYENVGGTLQLDETHGWQYLDKTSKFKPSSLEWGDWDGDGDLDLFVGMNAGGGWGRENRIYEQVDGELRLDAGRNYGWQSTIEPGLNAETTYAISAADADGDGDLDLAVGNGGLENGGQANLILQNRAPVVALRAEPQRTNELRRSTSVAWGDWDGDGDLDLAVGNDGEPAQVYENNEGKLSFAPEEGAGWASTVMTGAMSSSVAWGDWEGDGDLDLAVGNNGQANAVYENEGGTLALDPVQGLGWISQEISATRSVAWGDWDRDGDLDLATANCGGSFAEPVPEHSQVYENENGTLLFDPANRVGWISPEPLCAWDAAWGDWEDDGDLDLALGARVYENVAGFLLLNDRAQLGWQDDVAASSVSWGDVDGNGYLDLAVGTWNKNRVYENTGGMLTFAPRAGRGWESFDIKRTRDLTWVDMDGDKDLDLVVANAASWGFEANQVYENVGDELATHAAWRSRNERFLEDGSLLKSHAVAAGDMDQDGDLDLAFANYCTDNGCQEPVLYNQVYENVLQSNSGPGESTIAISIDEPYSTASADFYASPELLASGIITLPYTLRQSQDIPVGRVEAVYSLDGGGSWKTAVPSPGTQTANLEASAAGTQHAFGWDTFASGFFGQSDNVAIRMVAYVTPLRDSVAPEGTYRYANSTSGSYNRTFVTAVSFPFRVQSTQIRVMDQAGQPVEGAWVFKLPAGQQEGAALMPDPARPLATDDKGLLPGGGELQRGDRLVALRPVTPSEWITFTDRVSYFHTSAPVGPDGLEMSEFREPGTVELQVAADNPLLLFHVDVSLEWDGRHDQAFLAELEQGMHRASELLYDVTDGQAALGTVRVLQNKELWPTSDVVVLANNGMRPSAAIGGVAQRPLSETVITTVDGIASTKVISSAYANGQIKMGTVWDPFGQNSGDLGPDWWQALAHEFAHYLFFLPDNYLGFRDEDVLGRINCQGSFMTSTYDPAFTELLTAEQWTGPCLDTLAAETTGRTDWETIRNFYPMLKEPDALLEGPRTLPLAVTNIFFVDPQDGRDTLRARNFDIRDENNERIRLPGAHAYLFKTQGTTDPTDDVVIFLGNPTGGGDRLKVRGAHPGDRLCLFDRSGGLAYAGCDEDLQATDVSIAVRATETAWQPEIQVHPVTSRTMQVSVTQPISGDLPLSVQLFPQHYWSVPNFADLAPTSSLSSTGALHTQTLNLRLPAYELAARVWVEGDPGRETITYFSLNPPWEAGPNSTGIGGPNSTAIGGPNSTGIGGPNSTAIGGPNSTAIGGPNSTAIGGPNSTAIGGPNSTGIGGPNSTAVGGPNSTAIGGPNSTGIGGPNSTGIGGAQTRSSNAPILSADAQVVVYSKRGFFEPNGIDTLQIIPHVPQLDGQPWLVPVGQGYQVRLDPEVDDERIIAFTYLQRDVPEGYEHTLVIYFLPAGQRVWQRLPTQRYVENLVVADLLNSDGVYAVMSTLALPPLAPGWNLFTYPLPDARPLPEALASIAGSFTAVYKTEGLSSTADITMAEEATTLEFGQVYAIRIAGSESVTPYLAPPQRTPDGLVPGS